MARLTTEDFERLQEYKRDGSLESRLLKLTQQQREELEDSIAEYKLENQSSQQSQHYFGDAYEAFKQGISLGADDELQAAYAALKNFSMDRGVNGLVQDYSIFRDKFISRYQEARDRNAVLTLGAEMIGNLFWSYPMGLIGPTAKAIMTFSQAAMKSEANTLSGRAIDTAVYGAASAALSAIPPAMGKVASMGKSKVSAIARNLGRSKTPIGNPAQLRDKSIQLSKELQRGYSQGNTTLDRAFKTTADKMNRGLEALNDEKPLSRSEAKSILDTMKESIQKIYSIDPNDGAKKQAATNVIDTVIDSIDDYGGNFYKAIHDIRQKMGDVSFSSKGDMTDKIKGAVWDHARKYINDAANSAKSSTAKQIPSLLKDFSNLYTVKDAFLTGASLKPEIMSSLPGKSAVMLDKALIAASRLPRELGIRETIDNLKRTTERQIVSDEIGSNLFGGRGILGLGGIRPKLEYMVGRAEANPYLSAGSDLATRTLGAAKTTGISQLESRFPISPDASIISEAGASEVGDMDSYMDYNHEEAGQYLSAPSYNTPQGISRNPEVLLEAFNSGNPEVLKSIMETMPELIPDLLTNDKAAIENKLGQMATGIPEAFESSPVITSKGKANSAVMRDKETVKITDPMEQAAVRRDMITSYNKGNMSATDLYSKSQSLNQDGEIKITPPAPATEQQAPQSSFLDMYERNQPEIDQNISAVSVYNDQNIPEGDPVKMEPIDIFGDMPGMPRQNEQKVIPFN